MKRSVKIILLMFVLLLCSTTLFACTSQGASAYEIAVANGFVGTQTEWLASLKGADGKDGEDASVVSSLYDDAVENGYEGTFWEFVEEHVKGDKGDVGEDIITVATNKAITSVVSVYCTFTKTVTTGFPFNVQTSDVDYTSAGAGVIIDLDKAAGDAYIVTNYHVVYSKDSLKENKISDRIKIYLFGAELPDYAVDAVCIGGSMTYDIAVLKVTASEVLKTSGATKAELSQNKVYAGDIAIAIGNPEGDGISASSGVVSVDSESIQMTGADDATTIDFRVIRIDTAVNGGNSGGGLFDKDGRLIGIVNAKNVSTNVDNIGYALPIDASIRTVYNLIRNYNGTDIASVKKSVLGITTTISESKAVYNATTQKTEIIEVIKIYEVTADSVASSVGLQVDDIIKSVEYEGQTFVINRNFQLGEIMLLVETNKSMIYNIEREGEDQTITITFSEYNTIT